MSYEQRKLSELEAKVGELAEDNAALKAQLMDQRWQGVDDFINGINEHLAGIYARLDRIERVVRGD